MSMDWGELQQDVIDALTDMDAPTVVLTKVGRGTLDTATGDVNAPANADHNFLGMTVPWDETSLDGNKYEWDEEFHSGTQITLQDVRLVMAALTDTGEAIVPEKDDRITLFDGQTFVIKSVSPIRPAKVTVAYDIRLRG